MKWDQLWCKLPQKVLGGQAEARLHLQPWLCLAFPCPLSLPPFLLWPFSTNNRLLNPGLRICSIRFYRGPEVGWIWKQIRNGIRVARKKWDAQLNLSFRETTHFGAGVSISKLLHGTYLYFKKVFRFLKFKLKWPLFSAKSGKLLWRDWGGLNPPVWWSEEQLRCFKHGRCRIQASPQTSESASVLSRDPPGDAHVHLRNNGLWRGLRGLGAQGPSEGNWCSSSHCGLCWTVSPYSKESNSLYFYLKPSQFTVNPLWVK